MSGGPHGAVQDLSRAAGASPGPSGGSPRAASGLVDTGQLMGSRSAAAWRSAVAVGGRAEELSRASDRRAAAGCLPVLHGEKGGAGVERTWSGDRTRPADMSWLNSSTSVAAHIARRRVRPHAVDMAFSMNAWIQQPAASPVGGRTVKPRAVQRDRPGGVLRIPVNVITESGKVITES
jgi:hypothetical protein